VALQLQTERQSRSRARRPLPTRKHLLAAALVFGVAAVLLFSPMATQSNSGLAKVSVLGGGGPVRRWRSGSNTRLGGRLHRNIRSLL